MNKEDQRFERLMCQYFPRFSLEKGFDGMYKNTHVLIAHAMYQWGVVDADLFRKPLLKEESVDSCVDGGWSVEVPSASWADKK